ncbi:trichohyalin-like [Saccostrea echinata]|uniref:trichohyalin-like n=1 Tax=Saccostrea echinata TaxID=191078 RepID=UPI002A832C6B|nr:trichohyalin-like [Saccostrea echinata]
MSEEEPQLEGLETAPGDLEFHQNIGSDSDLDGALEEDEEDIAAKLCLTARKMDEMLDYMITSGPARKDNAKKITKSQNRPCHTLRNRQSAKERPKSIRNARPRTAETRSPERKQSRGISASVNQQTVEMRRRILELEKEVDLLRNENRSLREQSAKPSHAKRLSDETIHNKIQSGIKKEKRMYEMLLSDNQRKFHELESKHRYLMEDKDTLQSRIRIFEKEIENHINTLQQTRRELFAVNENNKQLAEENRLLKKENHSLKSRMQTVEAKLEEDSEHELILRQHMREEYEKKLNSLEKEIFSMKTRVDKKKDVTKAKSKHELGIVTEHYQTVIKNLQSDREKLQKERDAAVLRIHQYKEKWSEKCKREEIKSRGKIQVLERQVREMEMEKGFLEEEKQSLEDKISKMMNKKGQEAETLMHIEDVLRKHDNDLEKQIQELQREKEESNVEKEKLQTQLQQHEKYKDNMQTQLKTTREVLENRISELYQRNERLQTENTELKRCTENKKGELIRTITEVIGHEESSKRDKEQRFQDMIESFQKEKKGLDEELDYLRRRLNDIEEEREKLLTMKETAAKSQREEIQKYQEELKALVEEKNLLIRRFKDMETKNNKLKDESENSRKQMETEYEEIVDKIRNENDALKQEKESLEAKVDELEYTLTLKNIDEEESKQTEIANYQKTIGNLQEEIAKEKQRFHEKENKWKIASQSQAEKEEALNIRNASLERTVQKYLKEIETLKNRILDHEQGIGHYQNQIEHILQEKALIQAQLKEYQNKKENVSNEEMVLHIQAESKKLKEIEEQLERENQELKSEKQICMVEKNNLQERVRSLENQLKLKENKVNNLTQDKAQLLQTNEEIQTRLKEKQNAGDQTSESERKIVEASRLSVEEVGTRFTELYEEEFLKSVRSLTSDVELCLDERDAIECLLRILQTIYKDCGRIAEEQLDDLQMVMGMEVESEENLTKVRHIRNYVAVDCLSNISKKIKQGSLQKSYSEYIEHCENYADKSIELCWLMKNLDPPALLDFSVQQGDILDEAKYRLFSESGDGVDYLVWPAILYKGDLLQKGVVNAMEME